MTHADFVHLRVHTAYSLAEGAIQVKELANMCREHAMPAMAMTDTNNIFGALEFSPACAELGVQPIIGCQLGLRRNITSTHAFGECDNLVLLVQNQQGYGNLLKLLSAAYLNDDEAQGIHLPIEVFAAHSAGLIALSGGANGPLGHLLVEGQVEAAQELLERLLAIFPGNFYMEISRHAMKAEKLCEAAFVDLAYKYELPLVATNEVFFATPDMYEAHDALICIAGGEYVSQEDRRRLTPQHYFKSAGEMRLLFRDMPEAIDNTLVIARRCAFMVEPIKPILPSYDCGEGRNEEDELRVLAMEGLEKRLGAGVFNGDMSDDAKQQAAQPYRERLEYELNVIVNMKFSGYFLIVADFINWAKTNAIPVGPGRGSGAGSVVAWSLCITDLDPLRFGLLFERFLNPERISMPDFDIDFCQEKRGDVILYVQEKYGYDHVAQIITFGKLQARAVLRDVGRVLEMPYPQVDRICKLVPNNPAKPATLDEAIASEPQMRQMMNDDDSVARLLSVARKLEGLYRHASTHAAGVVIGNRPLDELIPLYRDQHSNIPVSGFNMKYIESAGLVKFDFLGLKTLTVIAKTVEFIVKRGEIIDISTIPLDDTATFEMLGRGDSTGVFQLESSGMIDVLKKLEPSKFEDIIAIVALYRPGPMENIPRYIACKHGREEPDYLYPTLQGILDETFGIIIYQEQVMQIAQELSGYTLGGADILRRAMGKKDKAVMSKQRKVFVDGAVSRGVPADKATDIFDQVDKFAGYGFNKSHAAAYAMVAYQTAYLKAHYPVEFLAASMTLENNNTDKLAGFRRELNKQKISLLPPDINASDALFAVERDEHGVAAVRYALAAIKNVGEESMKLLVKERKANGPFNDLSDFVNRLDAHAINKRQLENLIRAGAFDSISANRKRLFRCAETLLRHAVAASNDRKSDQIGLFGGDTAPHTEISIPEIADWTKMQKLREEAAAIGFYLSGHPLDAYEKSLRRIKAQTCGEIINIGHSGPVKMAGTVVSCKERTSAKGNRYAFVQLSDSSGDFEITVFAETLSSSREILTTGNCLFIRANAQFDSETPRFTAHGFESLDKVAARSATGLKVLLDTPEPLAQFGEALSMGGPGNGRVLMVSRIESSNDGGELEVEIALPDTYRISSEVLVALRAIPGISAVEEF